MPKDRITVTLDADLLEELRKEAEKEGCSLSQYLEQVFKWFLINSTEQDQ